MGLEKQGLVDALIAYWAQGPEAVDEESRRICREIARVLARSMTGDELLALQEAPHEHRQEIETRVAVWLAMNEPREQSAGAGFVSREVDGDAPPRPAPKPVVPYRSAAPPPAETGGVHIHQTNEGGSNVGTIGTLHGGFNLALPASVERSGAGRAAKEEARAESRKLRILFLGANPDASRPLRLDEEVHAIDRVLSTASLGSRCELVQKWAVRVGELQEHLLRTKPNVVHFSGHGSRDRSLLLQADDGSSRPVAAERLARLLARFNQRLRCVVLNACYTSEHGPAIAEHIDCVLGMSRAVPDPAAIRFAAAFYQAVAWGCSVQDAFEQACSDIELGEMGSDDLPVLLAPRCDPAQVFLIKDD